MAELPERLPTEVAAIHEEEVPPGVGGLDKAVDEGDGREGLAASGDRPHLVLGDDVAVELLAAVG